MAPIPQLSAHRGGPEGQFAANAIETIEAACALGVDLVEFDVMINPAGEFVIGHDRPSALPLRSVLAVLRGRVRAHVDLKVTRSEVEIVDLCTEVLGPVGFIVTTRYPATIRRIRAARPDVLVGLSIGRESYRLGRLRLPLLQASELWPWRRLRRSGANLVAAQHLVARLGVLAGAYRRGLPVLVWTVNSERLIRWAQRDERIYAFTTDYPRLALRLASEVNLLAGGTGGTGLPQRTPSEQPSAEQEE